MLENFRNQVASMALDDRNQELRTRRAAVLGDGAHIFRLGGNRSSARKAGRR